MKTLVNCLIFFLIICVGWGKFVLDKNLPLDDFIEEVIRYCKQDKVKVIKNNGEEENREAPNYISDFGLELAKLKARIDKWEGFLEAIKSKVKGDTNTKVQALLNELYVEEINREEGLKAKASKSAGVSPQYLSKDEINTKAKGFVSAATPTSVTIEVLHTISNEADKTYIYFGKTSEILGEILKGIANSLNSDEVAKLADIKILVDNVTRACTPFYKTGTFIFLLSLFIVLIIATIVFTAITVHRFMKAKEQPPPITPKV
jgi:hypothetical protein